HVPEPKTVKNRVHLDLHFDERDEVVARAIASGATKLWDGQLGPQTWVTLADPEGNEFCIA
ncbi:MAG: VOC family protein, partial [Actinomycetota bacterium]|nr:VOC family protein [Actinomycetota bacterium]